MFEVVRSGALEALGAPELERECGVRVVFTGRGGGLSEGPRKGLNLSYNVCDDPRSVTANRRSVAAAFGMPLEEWVTCQQVHGTAVAEVGELDAGRGARDYESALARTDATVTLDSGLVAGVLTADCLPVVLVEPLTPALAVVHAGWRGVVGGIVTRGVEKLQARARGRASDTIALIGPHIGACCFEVGEDVAHTFTEALGADCVRREDGSIRVDLAAAVRGQLESSGVLPTNIHDTRTCTSCSPGYFSFRRDPLCGRQAALAVIHP